MSLLTRIERLEVDMDWLRREAWLDRCEMFMDLADITKQLVAHDPKMRAALDLLPDGSPKPPAWLFARGRARAEAAGEEAALPDADASASVDLPVPEEPAALLEGPARDPELEFEPAASDSSLERSEISECMTEVPVVLQRDATSSMDVERVPNEKSEDEADGKGEGEDEEDVFAFVRRATGHSLFCTDRA